MSAPQPFQFLAHTTLAPVADWRVEVANAALGRAWVVDARILGALLRWFAGDELPASAEAVRHALTTAGLIVARPDHPPAGHVSSVVGRYHRFSEHERYRDGPDKGGRARRTTIARFADDDLAALAASVQPREPDVALPPDLAAVTEATMHQMREYRELMRTSDDQLTYLYSFGAANDLYVLDLRAPHAQTIRVDPDRPRDGHRIDAAPFAVAAALGVADAPWAIVVVASTARYKLRYKHEKALRGLLVDGGRVLGRLGCLAGTLLSTAVEFRSPPSPDVLRLLHLDFGESLAIGTVVPQTVGERKAIRPICPLT